MLRIRDNHKNRLAKLLTKAAFCALATITAHADVPGGSGGGNAEYWMIEEVINMIAPLKNGDALIKRELINFVRAIVAIPPKGEIAEQILFMSEHGLIED
ncbi:MAG: hypothetical protein ABL927_07930, partial [Bdellovibrionales bacterium]